jgi:hypothetical protein
LDQDNVLWLKAQAVGSAKGTVSDVLDRLVSHVRADGRSEPGAIRSVAGTIDLPEDDPDLAQADTYVRTIFDRSLSRPMLAREPPPRAAGKRTRRG